MKKKNLKSKLSLKVKDLSVLTGKETKDIKGGIVTQACPPWCETMSCPEPDGYSCGPFHCQSQIIG